MEVVIKILWHCRVSYAMLSRDLFVFFESCTVDFKLPLLANVKYMCIIGYLCVFLFAHCVAW